MPNPLKSPLPKIATPIPTFGEAFLDGALIDLVRADRTEHPQLALWDGRNETVGPCVEHNGHQYVLGVIDVSILRELALPTQVLPHGTTRNLLTQICKLMTTFAGLDEKSAALISRVVLCSHVLEALPVAPTVAILSPDMSRGNRIMALLSCLCWRALSLTGVTPAALCSLPSGAGFTLLINQKNLRSKLLRLLDDASNRGRKILYRGRLLDLFGVQVIHTLESDDGALRAIPISVIPSDRELPAFDLDTQRQITKEFQAKLLNFRRVNLASARNLRFSTSKFSFPLRDLAWSLAAATPDDQQSQEEIFELLRDMATQIRSETWVDLSAIAVESLLVVCKENESPAAFARVSDLVQIAQELLSRRGGEASIDLGQLGKHLKLLGFTSERDAKGKKLRLTKAVRDRIQQLARNLGLADYGNRAQRTTAQPASLRM